MANLSGQAAIIGVGASRFERRPEVSALTFASQALNAALADAGLEKEAIDGLIVQIGSPRGPDYDSVAQTFGLSPRFCSQTWAHGRFTATVLTHAAMAVATGMATRVACLLAMKNSDLGRIGEADNPFFHEQSREGGGPHGEEIQIGMSSPVAGAAMALDVYCRRYGVDRELLAEVPLTFRRHAELNPEAVARAPLSADDYLKARPIIDPIRLYDCSLVGDGAVCVIVSARDLAQHSAKPVWITGAQGIEAGRDSFIFAPRGLGMAQQSTERLTTAQARARPVWAQSGLTPETVDVLGLYDSFSPLPVYALEDFGFCPAGEGLRWIQGGRIGLGGDLPTNTSGGQLSHAQVNGWAQVRELVLQLRGQAGQRQVPNARKAMWATVGGDALTLEQG
jgi:acetyl-CoA acetyltransferase